jgi:hypothetical protein
MDYCREVATQRIELGTELRIEHVAYHRHARRPLRHSAEIGMTELRHGAAAGTRCRKIVRTASGEIECLVETRDIKLSSSSGMMTSLFL